MMLDFTKLLQAAISLDNQLFEKRDLLLGPTAHLQHAVLNADQALTTLYGGQSKYSLRAGQVKKSTEQQAEDFAHVLFWFLVVSARLKWTHLVVMTPEEYQKLVTATPCTKLVDLDREALAIKNLFLQSYYTHRQADFRHAWHLLLKMGLVDYQVNPTKLMQAYDGLFAAVED
ncbi:hypothetical protein [Limosilactobacillus ingluviei]|nr:hypothetical protein [Limosilactobacillus ingluviei]